MPFDALTAVNAFLQRGAIALLDVAMLLILIAILGWSLYERRRKNASDRQPWRGER